MLDSLVDKEITNTVFPLSTQVIVYKQAKDGQLRSILTFNLVYFHIKVKEVMLIYTEKNCIP